MPPRLSLTLAAVLAMTTMLVAAARADAAAGDLDPSFSGDGIAEVDFGAHATFEHPPAGAFAKPIGVQPNGDLILAGSSRYLQTYDRYGGTSAPELAYASVRPDGSLNPAFGEGGKLEGDLGIGLRSGNSVLQPDGRILTAGLASTSSRELVVARLTAAGHLDSSFAGDGVAAVTPLSFLTGGEIALDTGGRIVVAYANASSPQPNWQPDVLSLDRLNPDGSRDGTFHSGVNLQLPEGRHYGDLGGVAVDGAGRILVSANITYSSPSSGYALAVTRFLPDGQLDTSYGNAGTVEVDATSFAGRVNVDAGGRAYVWLRAAGSGYLPSGSSSSLLRLTEAGAPDETFGQQGRRELPPFAAGDGLTLDASGAIVVPGYDGTNVAVTRLLVDGQPDSAFTSQPWRPEARCLRIFDPSALVVADGSIVVAGGYPPGSFGAQGVPARILVARYQAGDGSLAPADPDPAVQSCPPCVDSVVADCPPYETTITIAATGRRLAGEVATRYARCLTARLVAVDRRRGRLIRVASTVASNVEPVDYTTSAGTYKMTVPRDVSGKVFVRLRPSANSSECRAGTSDAVRIKKRR